MKITAILLGAQVEPLSRMGMFVQHVIIIDQNWNMHTYVDLLCKESTTYILYKLFDICENPIHIIKYYQLRAAVRIGTGGDATHTGEELKGPRGPNCSGGTKKSTRLTSKYVLRGKTKKAKILWQLKSSLVRGRKVLGGMNYLMRSVKKK